MIPNESWEVNTLNYTCRMMKLFSIFLTFSFRNSISQKFIDREGNCKESSLIAPSGISEWHERMACHMECPGLRLINSVTTYGDGRSSRWKASRTNCAGETRVTLQLFSFFVIPGGILRVLYARVQTSPTITIDSPSDRLARSNRSFDAPRSRSRLMIDRPEKILVSLRLSDRKQKLFKCNNDR